MSVTFGPLLRLFLAMCFLGRGAMGIWRVSSSDYSRQSCRGRLCTCRCGIALLRGGGPPPGAAGPRPKFPFTKTHPPAFRRVRPRGSEPSPPPGMFLRSNAVQQVRGAGRRRLNLHSPKTNDIEHIFTWAYNVHSKILLFFLSASPITEL